MGTLDLESGKNTLLETMRVAAIVCIVILCGVSSNALDQGEEFLKDMKAFLAGGGSPDDHDAIMGIINTYFNEEIEKRGLSSAQAMDLLGKFLAGWDVYPYTHKQIMAALGYRKREISVEHSKRFIQEAITDMASMIY